MRWRVIVTVLALAATACGHKGSGFSPSSAAPSPTPPPVTSDADFDPANFTNPTQVTNPYFPLVPGTRFTWKGHALDEGERIKRQIEFTVTDMTKVIDGVETVVAWDRDFTDGALEEVELTFFAQDDDGTVWYFGEYPEEYDGKKIVKSPVWLGGLHEARTGITMQALPRIDTPDYAEGWGGTDVDWTDRGKVDQVGIDNCVPVDCYTNVGGHRRVQPRRAGQAPAEVLCARRGRHPDRVERATRRTSRRSWCWCRWSI